MSEREEMTAEEAHARQEAIVKRIKERGWRNGVCPFTDAQVWQGAVDARSGDPWTVAAHLVGLKIEGREPPSSPTYAEGAQP